uniref:Uncharacterized protein n=1 Tax=Lactuca sativa TaxID=4236 RepID=A0A9R1V3Z1_LACSA|nr:hypothetical protein LSAT_V11C700363490 [Lactuca sativa]
MSSFLIEASKFPLICFQSVKYHIKKAKIPWEFIPIGHKNRTPVPLFKELKDEEVEFFRNKFAGNQADRANWAVKEEAEAKKVT